MYLHDFMIDRVPVSNGEFLEFIDAGGYRDYRWWYAEGWDFLSQTRCEAPLYWELNDGQWMIRDFCGLHPVSDKADEPVSHVSYYEAAAFAKWAGNRLPTEAEWEKAACFDPDRKQKRHFPWGDNLSMYGSQKANLFENQMWGVARIGSFPEGRSAYGCHQMIGDVWEWTSSDYVPYPGFKSEFDEYNDKWFVGPEGAARRIIRHAPVPSALHLSELFPSSRTLDDLRIPLRARSLISALPPTTTGS